MAAVMRRYGVQNRRVLVVDDNRAIHDDFNEILGASGNEHSELDALHAELFGPPAEPELDAFELESAYQGEEAIERVRDALGAGRPYALAFVDIRMPPGIDGIETTARLLAEDPELGIVICSAYSDYSWEDMVKTLGQTDRVLILKKPFDPVEVRQLAHALQKRWELARTVALRMEDLTDMVDARTRELEEANVKLELEAAAREEALQKLEESNAQVTALAYQDGLTGLPNRRLLNEHLEKVLARARRKSTEFAVLFIDFDNFKLINDTIGHQAADGLLKELAKSLSDLIRLDEVLTQYVDTEVDLDATITVEPITDSVLSRLGGDEFVVLLPDTRDRFAAGSVASRILQHLERPIRTQDRDIVVTASIGIATFPEDGQSVDTLIRNADTAMYHAKQQGKAAYQYYSAEMNAASVERLTLETGLRRAIEDEALELHFQPQVELGSGRIIGCEALLRWRDPVRGYIAPAEFIHIAEDTGLILPIGEWVINRACAHAVEWQRAGLPPVPVSVNVSAVQFRRQNLPEVVSRALAATGLDPALLDIEITETAIMSVRARAVESLEELRALGVTLSLDDFGTGYSSLSYLKRFPISMLKIDRSFISELLSDGATSSITEAIISMTHILGLTALAEGVENAAQIEMLARLGCDAAQGFFFSAPVTAEEMPALLRRRRLPVPPTRAAVAK
ncbi:MAG: EAL domain-containing protein [Gammaproteobacteria bacterium]|nr:EAL domain-containing protein [Gammaproteobacteria bacterium]